MTTQVQVVEKIVPSQREESIIELADLDLALVGGGCGEVVFG